METTTQAPLRTKVLLTHEDRDACERIIARNPTVQNLTDAVRHAIHHTDRVEKSDAA